MAIGDYFRNNRERWVRNSMRTPGVLIFGLVMAPCGFVLNLTSTVAPNWRTLTGVNDGSVPPSRIYEQGIWDVCIAENSGVEQQCGQNDNTYFQQEIIQVAQGMMVASLIVDLIGLAVAIPGVRCWRDDPQWQIATCGGVLIFCAGVLTIIPIAWYTHILVDIPTVTPIVVVNAGYCIVLGYIGSIMQVLGGVVMMFGCVRCCGGWNRGEHKVKDEARRREQPRYEPRTVDVPSLSRTRSSASSMPPPSRFSLDDDVSFPRAKSPAAKSDNSSFNGRPYDADL